MKTIATLYGDWSESTNEAADALSRGGILFRVCLTHDSPGTPTLSMPFGELRGLDNIRAFADGTMARRDTVGGVLR